MNTPLDKAILNMVLWRGESVVQAQAFLLLLGLKQEVFTGADIPGEIIQGSKHVSGIAVKILLEAELVECIGYGKSPRENAHGRRVALLRIPGDKYNKVRTWLKGRGYVDAEPQQLALIA